MNRALAAVVVALAAVAGVMVGMALMSRSDDEPQRVVVEHCDEWDEFFGGCDD